MSSASQGVFSNVWAPSGASEGKGMVFRKSLHQRPVIALAHSRSCRQSKTDPCANHASGCHSRALRSPQRACETGDLFSTLLVKVEHLGGTSRDYGMGARRCARRDCSGLQKGLSSADARTNKCAKNVRWQGAFRSSKVVEKLRSIS